MFRIAEGLLWLACCSGLQPVHADMPPGGLRTFTVDKAPEPEASTNVASLHARPASSAIPDARGLLRTTIGVGYVQGADWGVEALAAGSAAGLDLQLDSLFTYGAQGTLFDHGSLSVRHPQQHWIAEAGDLFSDLRGPSRGARLSWQATDRWRTGVALYASPRHVQTGAVTFAIRNRIEFKGTSVDGEIATNGSHFLRGRVSSGRRLDVEASYRRNYGSDESSDAGVQAQVGLWKGLSLSAGTFWSAHAGDASRWHSLAIRVPIHRSVGLTFERSFTTTGVTSAVASALAVDVHSNQLMLLQRYEWGATRALQAGLSAVDRDQIQSMASYTVGPRLNVALRVATQWQQAGPGTNWLEAQTTMRVARRSLLQVTVPVPRPLDTDRVRVVFEQGLPKQLSLAAEYGRPSAYQDLPFFVEPPRFKLMLRRGFDVRTPAGGGSVRGLVVDYVGRPVAGARVRLGSYAADTDADGQYSFLHVPTGEFDLSLDPELLPADYAWDGRARRVIVRGSSAVTHDLVVAPLNAIHGRVYVDRNTNGRFDPGEGVLGAVVALGDRVTATDNDGAYDFFNVLPGQHIILLDVARLPGTVEFAGAPELALTLRDDRPVVGADFVVTSKTKTVIWRTIK
jgi:hypothetical protein